MKNPLKWLTTRRGLQYLERETREWPSNDASLQIFSREHNEICSKGERLAVLNCSNKFVLKRENYCNRGGGGGS